jgi:hypothetical protein
MKATVPRTDSSLSLYRKSLAPWLTLSEEGQRKVGAAFELLVLQGREVPLDGRAIIAENLKHPSVAHSKIGDIIRLEKPEEVAAFTAYRRTMDLIPNNLQTDRSEGNREAITEAIKLADQLDHRIVVNKAEQFLLSRMAMHPIATMLAGAVLLLVACVMLGGGIFSAVPAGGTAAYGGVYVINKYTGDVTFLRYYGVPLDRSGASVVRFSFVSPSISG